MYQQQTITTQKQNIMTTAEKLKDLIENVYVTIEGLTVEVIEINDLLYVTAKVKDEADALRITNHTNNTLGEVLVSKAEATPTFEQTISFKRKNRMLLVPTEKIIGYEVGFVL